MTKYHVNIFTQNNRVWFNSSYFLLMLSLIFIFYIRFLNKKSDSFIFIRESKKKILNETSSK